MLHRLLKTSKALAWEIQGIGCEPLREPFLQAVFYEANILSAMETSISWIKEPFITVQKGRRKQKFSIRRLHGLWAGKAEHYRVYPDLRSYA